METKQEAGPKWLGYKTGCTTRHWCLWDGAENPKNSKNPKDLNWRGQLDQSSLQGYYIGNGKAAVYTVVFQYLILVFWEV